MTAHLWEADHPYYAADEPAVRAWLADCARVMADLWAPVWREAA